MAGETARLDLQQPLQKPPCLPVHWQNQGHTTSIPCYCWLAAPGEAGIAKPSCSPPAASPDPRRDREGSADRAPTRSCYLENIPYRTASHCLQDALGLKKTFIHSEKTKELYQTARITPMRYDMHALPAQRVFFIVVYGSRHQIPPQKTLLHDAMCYQIMWPSLINS